MRGTKELFPLLSPHPVGMAAVQVEADPVSFLASRYAVQLSSGGILQQLGHPCLGRQIGTDLGLLRFPAVCH